MGIWISEEVENVPDHVKDLCEKIFQNNGFDNCEVTTEPACVKRDNYFSIVLRLATKLNDKSFSLITKMGLVQEYSRVLSFTAALFRNEITVYRELVPKLEELQTEAGISDDEKYHFAKFYDSAEEPTEVIILEDLNAKGYEKLTKGIDYQNNEILLTLKELAKFHALAFALRNKDKVFFEEFKHKIQNFWNMEYNVSAVMSYYNTVQKGISQYFKEENKKQYLKESILGLPEIGKKIYADYMKGSHSVIGIGFTWKFKPMYYLENNEPKKIIILDYQHVNIGSIPIDVHFYLLNSTDHANRKLHYTHWLDYYFKEFEECLRKFDLKSEDVYPRKQFEKDLRSDIKYVFGLSVLIATFWARESEIRIQANRVGEVYENPAQMHRKTVVDLMDSIVELGYME